MVRLRDHAPSAAWRNSPARSHLPQSRKEQDMDTIVSSTAMRQFTYHAPEAELDELRGRILAARLPEQETVPDRSQGVQSATVRQLAHYWATEYDWRKVEAKL